MDELNIGQKVWYIEPECFFVAEVARPTYEGSSEYILRPTTIFVDNRYSLDKGRIETRISFNRESLLTDKDFNKTNSKNKKTAIKLLFWAKWL